MGEVVRFGCSYENGCLGLDLLEKYFGRDVKRFFFQELNDYELQMENRIAFSFTDVDHIYELWKKEFEPDNPDIVPDGESRIIKKLFPMLDKYGLNEKDKFLILMLNVLKTKFDGYKTKLELDSEEAYEMVRFDETYREDMFKVIKLILEQEKREEALRAEGKNIPQLHVSIGDSKRVFLNNTDGWLTKHLKAYIEDYIGERALDGLKNRRGQPNKEPFRKALQEGLYRYLQAETTLKSDKGEMTNDIKDCIIDICTLLGLPEDEVTGKFSNEEKRERVRETIRKRLEPVKRRIKHKEDCVGDVFGDIWELYTAGMKVSDFDRSQKIANGETYTEQKLPPEAQTLAGWDDHFSLLFKDEE